MPAVCFRPRQRRCRGAAVSAHGSVEDLDLGALYTSQIYVPGPQPVRARPVYTPGKGLGLEATCSLATGDLVLLDRPLGVAYGPPGFPPTNDELAGVVASGSGSCSGSGSTAAWVALLRASRGGAGGGGGGGKAAASAAASLMAEAAEEQGGDEAGQAAACGGDGGGSGTVAAVAPGGGLRIVSVVPDGDAVAEAVSCNSYGEDSEDAALAELRETDPLAFTGLWPRLSLLNHSCAPNTSVLVVGGALLLRAARPVSEGEELTTCYMGRGRFRHVAARRAALSQAYGFHCQCDRCLVEHLVFPSVRYPLTDAPEYSSARALVAATSPECPAGQPPGPLQWALDTVYGQGRMRVEQAAAEKPLLLQELNALLADSLEAGAHDALTALSRASDKARVLLARVEAALGEVDKQVAELRLGPRDASMVKASVGGLLSLRWELLAVSGVGDAEQVRPYQGVAVTSWVV
ncbi:hypothetical protein FOA52_014423 [Chlamydomonas sp. UWO 241]|nr:hypothetical protein FOA52_014423 [Chlamydomonas sp. UWO 241]